MGISLWFVAMKNPLKDDNPIEGESSNQSPSKGDNQVIKPELKDRFFSGRSELFYSLTNIAKEIIHTFLHFLYTFSFSCIENGEKYTSDFHAIFHNITLILWIRIN
jgi:hypothetical protein